MMRNLLVMVCIYAVACVDTQPQPTANVQADSMFLVLDEIESWQVQAPSVFTSGALLDQSRALVAAANGDLLVFDSSTPAPRVIATLDPPLVLSSLNPAFASLGLLVLAGSPPAIFELSPGGNILDLGTCAALAGTTTVIRVGTHLVVAVTPTVTGGFQINAVQYGKSGCETVDVIPVPCASRLPPTIAAGPNGHPIMSCSAPPSHPLMAVTADSTSVSLTELSNSASTIPDAAAEQTRPLWYGLPILALENGYTQVVADLRSDRRRIERWDSSGVHVGTSLVNAPIGLIATLPSRRRALGLRGGTTYDLVVFEWSWQKRVVERLR
jgi:hypothetical protein